MALEQKLDDEVATACTFEPSLKSIGARAASVRFSRGAAEGGAGGPHKVELPLRGLGIVLSIPIELLGKHSILDRSLRSEKLAGARNTSAGRSPISRDCLTKPIAYLDREQAPAEVISYGVDSYNDPIIEYLLRARCEAEQCRDDAGSVYADAVQLALVAKLLSDIGDDRRKKGNGSQKSPLPKWRLKRVLEYIDHNYARMVTLNDLSAAAGLSRMHFAAQFRMATGLRPHEFVLRRRVQAAQQLLVNTEASLVEIALNVGFQTQAHFTTVFKRFISETPHRWRSERRKLASSRVASTREGGGA